MGNRKKLECLRAKGADAFRKEMRKYILKKKKKTKRRNGKRDGECRTYEPRQVGGTLWGSKVKRYDMGGLVKKIKKPSLSGRKTDSEARPSHKKKKKEGGNEWGRGRGGKTRSPIETMPVKKGLWGMGRRNVGPPKLLTGRGKEGTPCRAPMPGTPRTKTKNKGRTQKTKRGGSVTGILGIIHWVLGLGWEKIWGGHVTMQGAGNNLKTIHIFKGGGGGGMRREHIKNLCPSKHKPPRG